MYLFDKAADFVDLLKVFYGPTPTPLAFIMQPIVQSSCTLFSCACSTYFYFQHLTAPPAQKVKRHLSPSPSHWVERLKVFREWFMDPLPNISFREITCAVSHAKHCIIRRREIQSRSGCSTNRSVLWDENSGGASISSYTLDRDIASTFQGPNSQIISIRTHYRPQKWTSLTQLRHPQAPFRFPTPSSAYLITVVMSSDGSSWMLHVQRYQKLSHQRLMLWQLYVFGFSACSHVRISLTKTRSIVILVALSVGMWCSHVLRLHEHPTTRRCKLAHEWLERTHGFFVEL